MSSLLERQIASIEHRLVLVAPPHRSLPQGFRNATEDGFRRDDLIRQVQRLRGSIYLSDGAVRRDQLTPDGLHRTAEDESSWHLVMLDGHQEVSACAWYMEHEFPLSLSKLRVRHSPLARSLETRELLSRAVCSEITRARANGLGYAELGGWAVAPMSRCTSDVLVLALATYGLSRFLGGALGMTTATVRHGSAMMLRRLGGESLEADGATVPTYFDPRYDCDMELLRFDSRRPSAKYERAIDFLASRLSRVPVYAAHAPVAAAMLSRAAYAVA
jgi:hypothetical protein